MEKSSWVILMGSMQSQVLKNERKRQENERETDVTTEAETGLIQLLMGATSQRTEAGSRS